MGTDRDDDPWNGVDAARSDRFLRRMGFKQTGGNYVLEGGERKLTLTPFLPFFCGANLFGVTSMLPDFFYHLPRLDACPKFCLLAVADLGASELLPMTE